MTSKAQIFKTSGAVLNYTRENNSPSGNPRWTIALHNGFTGSTAPNSAIAYKITGNEWFLTVSYRVTPKGRFVITAIQ